MSQASVARHEHGMQAAASAHVPEANIDHLEVQYGKIVDELRANFRSGVTKDLEWRLTQLKQLRKGLTDNAEGIMDALQHDLGRPRFEGVFAEVAAVTMEIDHVVDNLSSWMQPERVWTPLTNQPAHSQIIHEPKGVVLILAPWNFPINLAFMCLVSALAAGNVALIKPSEVSPSSAIMIEKIVNEYLDTSCVKVVQGAVPETTALLRLRYDHVIYTGNGAVGRIVMKACAEHLTPVTLELGGKSPAYVDKSCNLQVTARRIAAAKSMNTGQICISVDYCLVHESVRDAFIKELLATFKSFFGNDPGAGDNFGRIVNERHHDRIMRLRDPTSHGGELITVGDRQPDRASRYMPPTLVLEPSLDSPLMFEEIFGPILPIITVKDHNDAINFITSREHPLALYCFAEDQATIDAVVHNTTSGGVCVNDTIMHITSPYLPFGGVGTSGLGAYHGKKGFTEMSHAKSCMYRSTWLDPSIRYPPYSEGKVKALQKFATAEPMLSGKTQKMMLAGAAGLLGMAVLSKL